LLCYAIKIFSRSRKSDKFLGWAEYGNIPMNGT